MPTGGSLKGKWAFVTGSGRGIGQACAVVLAKAGAGIILTARSEDQLKETAELCKQQGASSVEYHTADVSKKEDIEALVKTLLDAHKHIDILVNNAGMAKGGQSPLEGDPDDWEMMTAVNVLAPMRFTRLLAPSMVEHGSGTIVNIGSVAAIDPISSMAAYCATKFALRGWSLSCYEALRSKAIKVCLINPGMVNTEMTAEMAEKGFSKERMIAPEDIAEALLLACRTMSPSAVPVEITVRPNLPVKAGTD